MFAETLTWRQLQKSGFPFLTYIPKKGDTGLNDLLKREIDLIDCYRLAVDFGKPAADKAMAVLNESFDGPETVSLPPEILSTDGFREA